MNLLIMTTMACAPAQKKIDVEVWLIDEEELVLYRKIKGGKEQVIPLHRNKSTHKFMCVDTDEFNAVIEQALERGDL